MNWILNSLEDLVAASFQYCKSAEELRGLILATYAHETDNAQIYQLTRDITLFIQGFLYPGDAKLQGMWRALSMYQSAYEERTKKLRGTPYS